MTIWADYLRQHKRSKLPNAVCEECERPFFVWPTDKVRGRGRFCSNTCKGKHARSQQDTSGEKNPRWAGGNSRHSRNSKRFRQRYPEKYAAHRVVERALREGRLKRQICERCGRSDDIHAHHEDYSRPLFVMWLCRSCHISEHQGEPGPREATSISLSEILDQFSLAKLIGQYSDRGGVLSRQRERQTLQAPTSPVASAVFNRSDLPQRSA